MRLQRQLLWWAQPALWSAIKPRAVRQTQRPKTACSPDCGPHGGHRVASGAFSRVLTRGPSQWKDKKMNKSCFEKVWVNTTTRSPWAWSHNWPPKIWCRRFTAALWDVSRRQTQRCTLAHSHRRTQLNTQPRITSIYPRYKCEVLSSHFISHTCW